MATDSDPEDFEGATFFKTSFKRATMRACDLTGVTMRSVDVGGLDIDSHDLFFGTLMVNGVNVVPLVDAELNRRFPGRELQTAQTPEGLRDGWVAVQAAWAATVGVLAEERNNPWGGGDWHPTVGDCVRVILEEEWAHPRYIRRDLALLA